MPVTNCVSATSHQGFSMSSMASGSANPLSSNADGENGASRARAADFPVLALPPGRAWLLNAEHHPIDSTRH